MTEDKKQKLFHYLEKRWVLAILNETIKTPVQRSHEALLTKRLTSVRFLCYKTHPYVKEYKFNVFKYFFFFKKKSL